MWSDEEIRELAMITLQDRILAAARFNKNAVGKFKYLFDSEGSNVNATVD